VNVGGHLHAGLRAHAAPLAKFVTTRKAVPSPTLRNEKAVRLISLRQILEKLGMGSNFDRDLASAPPSTHDFPQRGPILGTLHSFHPVIEELRRMDNRES